MSGEIRDLNISGAGSSGGGTYKCVSVSGAYSFSGDLNCLEFKCSGSTTCKGNVKTKAFKTSGSTTVNGNVEAEKIGISGHCKIKSSIQTNELSVSGFTKVEGDIKGNQIRISGVLESDQNIEAEILSVSGKIMNDGFINVESLYIGAEGGSSFNEIGASKVEFVDETINSPFKMAIEVMAQLFVPRKYRSRRITGNVIESDEVILENSNIKTIRAHKVIVGPNCLIEEIEYTDTLEIHESSTVLHQKQMSKY